MTYRKYNDKRGALTTCPTCKRLTLTPYEARKGYQCLDCTRRDES